MLSKLISFSSSYFFCMCSLLISSVNVWLNVKTGHQTVTGANMIEEGMVIIFNSIQLIIASARIMFLIQTVYYSCHLLVTWFFLSSALYRHFLPNRTNETCLMCFCLYFDRYTALAAIQYKLCTQLEKSENSLIDKYAPIQQNLLQYCSKTKRNFCAQKWSNVIW